MDKVDNRHKTFHLTRTSYEEMVSHCQNELPFEACGLLSGKNGIASKVWEMENIRRSPYSFSMDLKELENVFRQIERYNHQFMAVYHSHPSSRAYPSPEDIRYNNYPEVIHFIISLASKKPIVKAFQYCGQKVIPYNINVADD